MNIRIWNLVLLAGLSGGLLKADSLNFAVTTGIGVQAAGVSEPATFLMLLPAMAALALLARCAAP